MTESSERSGIIQAIENRSSFRAFLDRPVDRETITNVLSTARWSPSSTNMQPWQVWVVAGDKKKALNELLLAEVAAGSEGGPELETYLDTWVEPYKTRRWECGIALYDALEIKRDEKEKRLAQMMENYKAFGAPVVIYLGMESVLKPGSILDCGMFLQSLMLAAKGYGLETCPQATLVHYGQKVKEFLGISHHHQLLVGLAIGYGDYDHMVNKYRTSRMEVSEFTHFVD